ncbi:MAG: energy transducer TonB [Paludibacteraceae bacterium]|nr:energy transducer TonB [Paludibacteraceae bacterium]
MGNKSGINIAGRLRAFHWVLLVMLGVALSACEGHYISFKIDKYDFIDQELRKNIESIVEERFKDEPDVPLDLCFMPRPGLLLLDNETDSSYDTAMYNLEIDSHHYSFYGYIEDSLQYRVKACCILAGHTCYIDPDERYFKKTGWKKRVFYITHEAVCPCMEDEVYVNVVNKNEIESVYDRNHDDIYRVVEPWHEDYDLLLNRREAIDIPSKTLIDEDGSGDLDDIPVEKVQKKASFPGGIPKLMKYLKKNLIYPPIALKEGTEGKVIVRFVVGKSGEIKDVKVVRSVDPELDQEAIRIVSCMPKWVPAIYNNRPCASFYMLPVNFTLNK